MEEFEEGINAIAAPIYNQKKQPIASVAIAGPSYRLTRERMIDIGSGLLATVGEIAREVDITSTT